MGILFDNPIFLFVLAVLPAILLCVYIYKKDKVEKEPWGLLFRLFLSGCAITVAAGFLNTLFSKVVTNVFVSMGATDYNSLSGINLVFRIVRYLVVGAGVEETLKWIAVYAAMKPSNKNNDSTFDSVVYAVFVSLGFAMVENIDYVFDFGIATGIVRFFLSVPGHMINSIAMGFCFSNWNNNYQAERVEKVNFANGVIKKIKEPQYKKSSGLFSALLYRFLFTSAIISPFRFPRQGLEQ